MAKYDGKWLQAGMIGLFSTFPNYKVANAQIHCVEPNVFWRKNV